MFKKLKKDIVSIKKSLADILATLEYLKLQDMMPSCKNKGENSIRSLMFDVEGKWVYIPDYLARRLGVYEGTYYIFGFISNSLIGFSQDEKEQMSRINMYCVRDKDCTSSDIGKDGISVRFNENRLGKRIKHIPLTTRSFAKSTLEALKENITHDVIFAEIKVK